ncbi:hypothetical protein WH50_24065 [Pokkaliibacter plantistimulans]|uniref:Uncharacterized protein n=1 Tax=Pokkaliibacter plantistimulans TaxID=1635171 RepID=A0ABX5LVV0_9GAMM|nr:hypothetical protein WH50_24065 [Pokkaliibacter plantistimulans]
MLKKTEYSFLDKVAFVLGAGFSGFLYSFLLDKVFKIDISQKADYLSLDTVIALVVTIGSLIFSILLFIYIERKIVGCIRRFKNRNYL